MSAVIRLRCPRCRDEVTLEPSQIALEVVDGENGGSYSFTCPLCGAKSSRAISGETNRVLMSVDVTAPTPMTEKEIKQFAEALHNVDGMWEELDPD